MPRRTPAPRVPWPPRCAHGPKECFDCFGARLARQVQLTLDERLQAALDEPRDLHAAVRAFVWAARRIDFLPLARWRAEATATIAASPLVQGVRQALRERYDAIEDGAPEVGQVGGS
jgi:hypothetical protein